MDIMPDMSHRIYADNRERLEISGVSKVLSFDEETFVLDTVKGRMTVKGENLHIISFNTETGDLSAEGKLHAFAYLSQASGGFLTRLFR